MGKVNRTCFVCGKQYSHCFSCPSDLHNPSWKSLFDDENCKEIFNILSKHGQGMISSEEAKELLNACDLTKKDSFTDAIKNHLNQILDVKVVKQIEDVEVVENIEHAIINETTEVVTEEVTEQIILPKIKGRKNKKK